MEQEEDSSLINNKNLTLSEALNESLLATLPFIVTYFINSLSRLAPFYFLKSYSEESVAAFGISISFYNIFCFFISMALSAGLLSRLSACYGASNFQLLGYTMHRGFLINMAVCGIISLVILASQHFFLWIGYTPELSQNIHTYLIYSLPAVYLQFVFSQLTSYLSALQIFLPPTIMQLIATALYLLSCWFLIEREQMGLIGAALANGIMNLLLVCMMIGYIWYTNPNPDSIFGFDLNSFNEIWDLFVHEFWVGSTLIVEWIGFEIVIIASGRLPTNQTAGYTGAVAIIFVLNISLALSNTVISKVGAAAGENNVHNGKTYLISCIILTLIGAVLMELVFEYTAGFFAKMVMPNMETVDIVVSVMHIYMFALPFDYLQYILGSGLRTIGKEKLALTVQLIGVYALALPIAYYLCFVKNDEDDGLIWGENSCFFFCCLIYGLAYYWVDWKAQFQEINSYLDSEKTDISLKALDQKEEHSLLLNNNENIHTN